MLWAVLHFVSTSAIPNRVSNGPYHAYSRHSVDIAWKAYRRRLLSVTSFSTPHSQRQSQSNLEKCVPADQETFFPSNPSTTHLPNRFPVKSWAGSRGGGRMTMLLVDFFMAICQNGLNQFGCGCFLGFHCFSARWGLRTCQWKSPSFAHSTSQFPQTPSAPS